MEKKERTIFFHKEYHLNIEKWLDRLILEGVIPVIIAIHSFTPVFQNFRRPWHIGLLYENDQRFDQGKSNNGMIPEDIPQDDNDSVLEEQIRLAAMNEKDPEKKKRLWNEYRKYKGLPQKE